ncbi:MAG: hypothetical protein V1858_00400 [Candidatus Gottesmanbacteria bacterium]
MTYAYDMDTPFIYKDIWDNQHFAWIEQDSVTKKWDLYYSTVPVNVNIYSPSSNFSLTLNITGDTLSIPSGALASAATISAQIGPLPASYNPAYTTIPRSFTFRPHGITFASKKEASANIYYTDGEIMGADERNMKVYMWDGTLNGGLGGWSTDFATSVNTALNRATVALPHFSLYGLALPNIQTNFQSPVTEITGSSIPLSYQLVNQATNQPADPPTQRIILDENGIEIPFWDEYKAELVDSNGNIVQTLRFNQGNGNLGYDTTANYYYGNFSGCSLPEGDYMIRVYLATIQVGSQNFHFTPTLVTFLPPLTTEDIYTMNDGSSFPFKFNLSQDGVVLTDQQALSIKIIKLSDNTEITSLTPQFCDLTYQYHANIQTKELNMEPSAYKGIVLSNNLCLQNDGIEFTIVDQGKAKGASH